jgi:uncharacterized protein
MIPKFPQFKKIELSDRQLIHRFTKDFAPYSDYNFSNLWMWDIAGQAEFSFLNNNLVIKFTDYLTQQPYYSFLGVTHSNRTVEKLLDFVSEQGLENGLRLVPEACIEALINEDGEYIIEENMDHSDYILSVEILKNYPGSKLANKRNYVRKFNSAHEHSIRKLNLSDKEDIKEIRSVFDEWCESHTDLDSHNEKEALRRFIEIAPLVDTITLGIYIDDKLEAFWSHEILEHSCTISHFQKANSRKFPDLYPVLMQESAKELAGREIFFINFEQDLGIPRLREGKMGYLPYGFLKKYNISRG